MATSNHAVGFYPRAQKIDHRVVPRPDSRYGVSKALRGARQPLFRQARHWLSVHPDRQFRDEADRQPAALDLDQPARLHPARPHRAGAPGHTLRDGLRRLEQPALVVRQLERLAARLPAAGQFRAPCRRGARRRSRPAEGPDRRALPGRHVLRRRLRRRDTARVKPNHPSECEDRMPVSGPAAGGSAQAAATILNRAGRRRRRPECPLSRSKAAFIPYVCCGIASCSFDDYWRL